MTIDEAITLVNARHPRSRIVNLPEPWRRPDDLSDGQRAHMKPRGLWYGIGTSWLEWVRDEMPQWYGSHLYRIDVDERRLLRLRTIPQILAFSNKYATPDGERVDWVRVAGEYAGIEIDPYQWDLRFDLLWYYSWDVASGCLWDPRAVLAAHPITGRERAHGRFPGAS